MSFPAIHYDAGSGTVVLPFTYPPVEQAGADAAGADDYEAIREDSVTESGLVQSVVRRIENFRTLNMTYVPNEDVLDWAAFLQYALQGYTFSYYPDAALSTHYLCVLADTNWSPKFGFRGIKKFTLRLRLAATGQDVGAIVGTGGGMVTPVTLVITAPDPLDPTGNFSVPHLLGSAPTLAMPVSTDDGLIRLQPVGWDATNVNLNASAPGLTGVVFLFP